MVRLLGHPFLILKIFPDRLRMYSSPFSSRPNEAGKDTFSISTTSGFPSGFSSRDQIRPDPKSPKIYLPYKPGRAFPR